MRELWQNQFNNLFLWVPFLMATGAGVYYTMPNSPTDSVFVILTIIFTIMAVVGRKFIAPRAICLAIFGFVWAALYTVILDTPQINRTVRDKAVTATVSAIDYTDDRARVYMKLPSDTINAIGRDMATIRVSVGTNDAPNIGDTVRANINLYPPATPYANESFDYARWAYFNGITATGYATNIDIIAHGDVRNVDALRNYLHRHADSFLSDSLVLGYKNVVPTDEDTVWNAVGVGHVWSISGFHMTLVSGWLFAIFFGIFRFIPFITRRVPARIPALICAWFGLMFYLFLSGLDVATMRAFLMTTLFFIAFIFGRSAMSMRNICVAFCILFLFNPHYVLQAGFQLSFAAIFGLIWYWNVIKPKMPENKYIRIVYGTVLTSIIATIFTTPFIIAHFGAIPIYSLIGNLVLLPIFSIAIMPLVIIGTIMAPFGLHAPLNLADAIYNFTFYLATHISEFPFATISIPHMPNVAMCMIVTGMLAVMFIRPLQVKINMIIGAILITSGILIMVYIPRPIFISTYDNELVVFIENNKIEFNKSRASNHYFAFDTWKSYLGFDTNAPNRRRKHNRGVYRFETNKFNLVYIQKFSALQKNIVELCNDDKVDYIVSYFKIMSNKCAHKIIRGGAMIYPSGKVEYINHHRPWYRHNPRT